MSFPVEFGSMDAADNARDEWADYRCPIDDDRRQKTVHFVSDTPDSVREQIEAAAEEGRAERSDSTGQADLTDHELEEIDFSKDRANVPWAQSIKAIAQKEGVDDWLAHLDPTLTVDEHRDVMRAAGREGGGARDDSHEDRAARKQRQAAARQQAEGCDHARGHCENGDPEACEFLREACGYDEDEVQMLLGDRRQDDTTEQQKLVTVGGGDFPEMDVTPEQAGALSRSWQGYKGAISRIDRELDDVQEAIIDARQAIRAINAIRERHGQDELHPDRLHDLVERLTEMPESIPEIRSLSHFADFDGDGHVESEQQAQSSGSFANETQGTLQTGVEADEVAEEKQVTLTGEDEGASSQAVPSAWRRQGTVWHGGPYSVQIDGDGDSWVVRLFGPEGTFDVATGLRDATQADEIAEAFTSEVSPDEVSLHSNDSTVPEAAAKAKSEAAPDSGGLFQF